MFQKIIDFFRRLFGGAPSAPKPAKPSIKEVPDVDVPDPVEEETDKPDVVTKDEVILAQDASEVTPDTVITVVTVDDPIVIPEEEDPPVTIPDTDEEPEPETETPTEVTLDQPKHQARFMWCLDNGHGKKTKGKRSPKLENGKQFFEYEFNRDIVKRIIQSLDKKGVKYFNVVPEVDTDNFLEGRVKRANSKKSDLPKLFVSVHANAAPAPAGKWASSKIHGIETWFFHNSSRGRKLATVFQKHLVAETGWKNRHIKSQATRQFFVLRKTNMTAVLTENGFYNNKEQMQELMKDSVRQTIADAHVAAIMEVEEKGLV